MNLSLFNNPLWDTLTGYPVNRTALILDRQKTTFGDISQKTLQLAALLTEAGVGEGQRTILMIPFSKDFIAVFQALLLLKNTVVLMEPDMGEEHFQKKLDTLQPAFFIMDSRLFLIRKYWFLSRLSKLFLKFNAHFKIPANTKIIAFGAGFSFPGKKSATHPANQIDWKSFQNFAGSITFTSGTTSEPKGVVHSIAGIHNSLNLLKQILGTDGKTVKIASSMPQYVLLGVMLGLESYVYQKDISPLKLLKFIVANQIQCLFTPPFLIKQWLRYLKKNQIPFPPTLKTILLGSAPVYKEFLEELNAWIPTQVNIICLYGMTENLLVASISAQEKLKLEKSPADCLGKPCPGVEIKISSNGEILVHSDQQCLHYLNHPNSYYIKTGDIGHLDGQGYLWMSGRGKNMIIRRHFNIYPELYESILLQHPEINDAVLFGRYNDRLADEEVFLLVDSGSLTASQVEKLILKGKYSFDKDGLPDFIKIGKVPRRGRSNKVDYAQLSQLF